MSANQQVAAAAEMMTALSQGFEAVRDIQRRLVPFDADSAAQYWQELGLLAVQTQMKMADCAVRMMGLQGESPFQRAMSIWQSPFSATLD